MINIYTIYKIIERIKETANLHKNAFVQILSTVTEMLYVCHFMSCLWFHIGYLEQ